MELGGLFIAIAITYATDAYLIVNGYKLKSTWVKLKED